MKAGGSVTLGKYMSFKMKNKIIVAYSRNTDGRPRSYHPISAF
jgi:hypothetical protein